MLLFPFSAQHSAGRIQILLDSFEARYVAVYLTRFRSIRKDQQLAWSHNKSHLARQIRLTGTHLLLADGRLKGVKGDLRMCAERAYKKREHDQRSRHHKVNKQPREQ